MSTQPGQTLSHYRLIEKIGEGGMGVVWKAVDTTLDREVAIKVLPEAFADDPERLARFEREAKLLASLNHPNIAAIHGLEESGELRFLVMELVPGDNLAQRVDSGPIPVEEALELCRQIAEALEAAHETGVIHRDLKPGNIRITPEGKIKVLDFGLAKALIGGPVSGDPALSPTITSTETRDGMILGTAAYMSPEQARGKAVDKRTDIWAFGCVLYEMLTARRPFAGETVTDILAKVLQSEPDWGLLPANTPWRIRDLVARCLRKEARGRVHDIADVRIIIEEVLAAPEQEAAGEMPARPAIALRRFFLPVAALLVGAAVASVAVWNLKPTPPEPPARKFALPVERLRSVKISPDGKHIAYVSSNKLWIRDLDRLDAREIEGTAGADKPFWSPDSAWVAYGSNGKLWKVPVGGGQLSAICQLLDNRWGHGAGGAWYPNGTIIFTTGNTGLLKVSAQGGDVTSLLDPDPEKEVDFHGVSALPDGRGVLFVVHRKSTDASGVDTFDTIDVYSGGDRATLLTVDGQEVWGPLAYSPTGHVLFHRAPDNPGVWAVPFSLDSLDVTGQPFLVAADASAPSVSLDGNLAYIVGSPSGPSQLVRVDQEGQIIERIGQPEESWPFPALSPDEERVAIPIKEHGKWDLWIHNIGRDTRTRLTFDGDCNEASWSPDGKHILYYTGDGVTDLRMKLRAADSMGESKDLGPGFWPSYSPDGKYLVYAAWGEQGNIDLFYTALEGDGDPVSFLATPWNEKSPKVSPDGRYLAYASSESGESEVYIRRFPSGEGRWQISVDGGHWPHWSGHGDRLFFTKGDAIFAVNVTTGTSLTLDTPRKLFDRKPAGISPPFGWPPGFDVSADGKHFVFLQSASEELHQQKLAVVLDWFEEFDE